MSRFLFGPVDDPSFSDRFLTRPIETGRWVAFSARAESWDTAVAPFNGRLPDALLLWPGYASVPDWVWSAPVPVIALAHDPNLLWHGYRHLLPLADLILTDQPSTERLERTGLRQTRTANLFGLDRHFLAEIDTPAADRDIDILFVGNLNPAVQPARLPWLNRLGQLADRHKVVIATGVFGAEYRALLRRTKLAFNLSIRGECNLRTLESAATGAVLLLEADNREVPHYLSPGSEYVPYSPDNFESMVAELLDNDQQRSAISKRARDRVRNLAFDSLIETVLAVNGPGWQDIVERAARRIEQPPKLSLAGRIWQRCSLNGPDADVAFTRDLNAAAHPYGRALFTKSPAEAEADLATSARDNRVARLGLATALSNLGRDAEAIPLIRRLLVDLESQPLSSAEMDTPPYPVRFDHVRVAWERASYDFPNDLEAENRTKREILKGRAYSLLASRTGELSAYRGAAAACPELPSARAALGCALARAGELSAGIGHLRFAVSNNPFDHPAAASLIEALILAGDVASANAVRASRRLLARAAPHLVPNPDPQESASPPPPPPLGPRQTVFVDLSSQAFTERFGRLEAPVALSGSLTPADVRTVLTLVAAHRPRRLLEIGAGAGHMTANLTAMSPDDAIIYSICPVANLGVDARKGPWATSPLIESASQQTSEQSLRRPDNSCFNHFGLGHKAMLIAADSRSYDFSRFPTLDFAFVNGRSDYDSARCDSFNAYNSLRAGGCLVWHGVSDPAPWVEVEKALAGLGFAEPVYRVTGTRVAFLIKGEGLTASASLDSSRVAVAWDGEFAAIHSLAAVNRAVCSELLMRGHHVALVGSATARSKLGATPLELPKLLSEQVGRDLPNAVTVRHGWPPDFTPPVGKGAFVLIQPWEYGRLPQAWVEPILTNVDEVWAYTRSVLRAYVSSGVPEDRLVLVPPGVDTEAYRPDLEPLPLQTRKSVKLLFVGGTIPRKGFDLLVSAYRRAFTRRDDVCLVIKEIGAGSFYRGQTATSAVADLRSDGNAPEVLLISDDLPEADLVRLYVACDALVHPYRGEGFALPVLEAMACGKPVVVTAGGPTDEFVPASAGWRVPSKLSYFPEERIGELPTVGRPWWLEPDLQALGNILRAVVFNARERQEKGRSARRAALGWTWARTASVIEDRIRVLRNRAPRRHRQLTPAIRKDNSAPTSTSSIDRGVPLTVMSKPSVILPATVKGRPRVSLTMIVKNEEHHLPDCLASVRDLVDEAVVVDTGSSDRTREIAHSFGAIVAEFPWIDHFAAARNAALDHASGDYAFWMDADDRLDEDNRIKLRALFDNLTGENDAYVLKCFCVGAHSTTSGTVVDHLRVFRRTPAHRWTYRIHEQILPALRTTNALVKWSGVTVRHVGYVDPSVRRRKLERDIRLLKLDEREHPEDPFTLFNLGSVYSEMGDFAAAVQVLEKSLARSHAKDSIVRKLYALLTQCYLRLGDRARAQAACEAGRQLYPDDAELLFIGAGLARENGDFRKSEELYRRLVEGTEADHFASVDSSIRVLKGRNNLAILLMEQNRLLEAEALWRAALLADPGFLLAHTGLGELYLRAGNAAGVAGEAAALRNLGTEGVIESAILEARSLAKDRQYATAIAVLEKTARLYPQAVGVRVAMSHIRLADGSPPDVLEASFRAILDIDSNNSQARHNLETLYRSTTQMSQS